jgi:hypothetical protein
MTNEAVNASPADVRKLAMALGAYKQEVVAAARKVRGALGSANWHDARKTQFEARYQDLQKRIDAFMSGEVDQMIRQLNDLAHRLDEIRNIRL